MVDYRGEMSLLLSSRAISDSMIEKDSDLTYKLAIALTPGISADVVRFLELNGISYREFIELPMAELSERLGPGIRHNFQNADRQEALFKAREESVFIKKHNIHTLFLLDDDYPEYLRQVTDAPVMLFALGDTAFDNKPMISMVGTRRCTQYGQAFCDKFVSDLASYYPSAAIVSGLAYGIDASSHLAALNHGLKTIAVLAHGLDIIYPAQHRDLARRILAEGGTLISEYSSRTRPYRNNFLQRNRIVAGLSELTFVVESEIKGGAMSTANQAFSYDREVFALPGRYNDISSSGTNMLIARGKARIFTSVADLMTEMRWPIPGFHNVSPPARNLFPELEGEAEIIYQLLIQRKTPVAIDDIHAATGIPLHLLISTLTELEFDGVVVKLPGARYEAQ